jgi:hypothetical protein
LRWIFAVIFAAHAGPQSLLARQVPWSDQQLVTTLPVDPKSVYAADLDADGDLDVVTAADEQIAWYENTDGTGSFGPQQVLSTQLGGRSVFAADLDGDGDVDILSSSAFADEISWFENTGGGPPVGFTSAQLVATLNGALSVFAADVDGDGDLDVLAASNPEDSIVWYKNLDGAGTFGSQLDISSVANGAFSVFAADVDGDGDLDALSASAVDHTIAWHANTDGAGSFSARQVITTEGYLPYSVFAADVDGDGDLDVLAAFHGDDAIGWIENTDGGGGFGALEVISTLADGAEAVFAADIDGDGDIDALSLSRDDDVVAWYENTDGAGGFGSRAVISALADYGYSVFAADLDGDGDVDVLSASTHDDEIAWYENETIHRSALFPQKSLISTQSAFPFDVLGADLDGDGDLDALSATTVDDRVAWYENLGGAFGSQQTITTLADSVRSISAADLDSDGDLDVLSASANDDEVAWYANIDGAGGFGTQQVLDNSAGFAAAVVAADLDGDGDLDVAAAAAEDGAILWYENSDGAGTFASQEVLTTHPSEPQYLVAADVDDDGDTDLLSLSHGDADDGTVAWHANDGAGAFPTQQVISTQVEEPRRMDAADVDGDGDLDVVVVAANGRTLDWFENTDGQGASWQRQTIADLDDEPGGDGQTALAVDLDGDGDVDVLAVSSYSYGFDWYENTDGDGSFAPAHLGTTPYAAAAEALFAGDLDRDGDVDVLAVDAGSSNAIAWYENRGGQFSLATTDVAQGVVANSELHDLLRITVTHEGRAGDSDVELSSLELQFDDGSGTPLSEAGMTSRIDELRLYLDDGAQSGVFDASDTMVASTTDFSSASDGGSPLTWPLTDDNADLQVPFGSPKTYFLVAELSASTSAFDVEHLTESSSTGEDAPNDIPLILEFATNVQSGAVSTTLNDSTCHAPFDLQLADRTVSASVTCEAGTVLTTETNVVVTASGDLTLRAGQEVEVESGLEIQAGAGFTVDVDDTLEP